MINTIKDYFTTMPNSHRLLILVGSMVIFWILENRKNFNYKALNGQHLKNNGWFIITAFPVQVLLGLAILKVTDYNLEHLSGLVHASFLSMNDSPVIQCLVAFIALDFLEYIYHVTMHRYKRLWMMHVVHHSDDVVDISTTLREHPMETLVRLTYLVLFLYLTGTEYWMLMLRQALQIVSNVFAHANFKLPQKLNRWVGYIFITPNLHHVHHHTSLPYTNCNYGDVLSIWDRIFGTFRDLNQEKVIFGVDTFSDINQATSFKQLLKVPFEKYRPSIKK